MNDLMLDYDEGILLQGQGGFRCGLDSDELDEMVLTNRNLICVVQKSTGFFSKPRMEVSKTPLDTIRVINGKPQVAQMNHPEHGLGMQILYTNGAREHFTFYGGTGAQKKEIAKWVAAITTAITGEDVSAAVSKPEKTKTNTFAGLGAFTSGLQSVVDNARQTIETTSKQFTDAVHMPGARAADKISESESFKENPVYVQPPEKVSPVTTPQQTHCFCTNCGQKLKIGVRFCHSCGSPVKAATEPTPPPVPPVPPVVPNTSPVQPIPPIVPPMPEEPKKPQRQQEYAGTILKCPNCGCVIGETTAICPDCGMRISRRKAVSSVQEFKDQLMGIEYTRKRGQGGVFGVYTAPDPADTKKLSLIRNFPIPNSVDDIMEFMFLAVANIDVALSKNTMMNKLNNTQQVDTAATIGRTISNAWVTKMQQAYQKAEIMFPSDPAFASIQRLYFEKMKELKIKV